MSSKTKEYKAKEYICFYKEYNFRFYCMVNWLNLHKELGYIIFLTIFHCLEDKVIQVSIAVCFTIQVKLPHNLFPMWHTRLWLTAIKYIICEKINRFIYNVKHYYILKIEFHYITEHFIFVYLNNNKSLILTIYLVLVSDWY